MERKSRVTSASRARARRVARREPDAVKSSHVTAVLHIYWLLCSTVFVHSRHSTRPRTVTDHTVTHTVGYCARRSIGFSFVLVPGLVWGRRCTLILTELRGGGTHTKI